MKTLKEFKEEYQIDERYDKDLDADGNGKLTKNDFKLLRAKKKKSDCMEAREDREDEEHYRSRRAKDEKAVPSEESPEEKMARKKLAKEEIELDEDCGAYETWDPKHPKFVANYKKYQSDNANQGSIKDFIDKEKAKPRRLSK
jgi:hypothetical protein